MPFSVHYFRKAEWHEFQCHGAGLVAQLRLGEFEFRYHASAASESCVMKSVARPVGFRVGTVAWCCGLLIAAGATGSASAADCRFETQGEGHVSAVIDSRTFRLDDGREVRLAGIETLTKEATALAALVVGRDVTLGGETDAPDRWGRQPAFVFAARPDGSVQGSDTSIQGLLLAQGEALVSAEIADKACAAELVAAEAAARQAGRGSWADPGVIKNAENPGEILACTGQFVVVEGKVLSVRQAGATFYVNFGRRWTRDFAATISKRMMSSFEDAGINLKSLENRRIRVRGWVEQRSGPRIELLRTGQIEVVDESDGTIRKGGNRFSEKPVPGTEPGLIVKQKNGRD
jgi:endonuclease YncB( thermonuclease family)